MGLYIPRENSNDIEYIHGTLHIQTWKDWEYVIEKSDRDEGHSSNRSSHSWVTALNRPGTWLSALPSWAVLVLRADLWIIY